MVQIEEYQEGSVHTVQEGGSSFPSGIASNGSVHTELQHHDNEGVEYDLDIPDHAPGFPRFPSFPPRRGDLINVVSNDEPPTVGETEQERIAREARNIDRFNRRQIEADTSPSPATEPASIGMPLRTPDTFAPRPHLHCHPHPPPSSVCLAPVGAPPPRRGPRRRLRSPTRSYPLFPNRNIEKYVVQH